LTNTLRKKVYSTLNSEKDESQDQLERERQLKENYKNASQVAEEIKQPKVRTPRKDKELVLFEEKYKQIESSLDQSVSFAMDFLAERMPKKIPVTQTEKDFFSSSLEAVMKKYKSSMIDYIPEMVLIASIGVFTLPRLKKDKTVVVDSLDHDIRQS